LSGLSLDFIPHQFFQLNAAASAALYPEQASDNPAFSRLAVSHPLDLSASLEPKFTYLTPSGIVLSLPVVYGYSAESSVRGRPLGDEQHLLSMGLGYTMAVNDVPLPFEVALRFLAPLYSTTGPRLQRLEFTGKMAIPVKKNEE
jgi:hypothetical protein